MGSFSTRKKNNAAKRTFAELIAEKRSIPIRLMSPADYVGYIAHDDPSDNLQNVACLRIAGKICPYCEAHKNGGKDRAYSPAEERFLFAFANLDSGKLEALDASKDQAKQLIVQIDKYSAEINSEENGFYLSLSEFNTPDTCTLRAMSSAEMEMFKDRFDAFDGAFADIRFYENLIDE